MLKASLQRHPIAFSLAAVAVAMPLIWAAAYPLLRMLPFYWAETVKYSLTLMAAAGMYRVLYRKWPLQGVKGRFGQQLVSFGWLGILCAVMAFLFSFDTPDTVPSISDAVGFVCCNLAIAVSEEVLFRGLILRHLLDSRQSRKHFVWMAVMVSSVLFGLRHFLNLIAKPHTLVTTTGQVCFTLMAGVYLCAVYLRTGHLWLCIGIHFLEDLFTGFWALVSSSAAAAQLTDGKVLPTVLLVAVHTVYVWFGVALLKGQMPAVQPIGNASCSYRKEENI